MTEVENLVKSYIKQRRGQGQFRTRSHDIYEALAQKKTKLLDEIRPDMIDVALNELVRRGEIRTSLEDGDLFSLGYEDEDD